MWYAEDKGPMCNTVNQGSFPKRFYVCYYSIRRYWLGKWSWVLNFFTNVLFSTVPPYLNEELTSSDMDVREGSDVSLRCMAKGSPEPEVTWRREDGQEISVGKSKGENVEELFKNRHLHFWNFWKERNFASCFNEILSIRSDVGGK